MQHCIYPSYWDILTIFVFKCKQVIGLDKSGYQVNTPQPLYNTFVGVHSINRVS